MKRTERTTCRKKTDPTNQSVRLPAGDSLLLDCGGHPQLSMRPHPLTPQEERSHSCPPFPTQRSRPFSDNTHSKTKRSFRLATNRPSSSRLRFGVGWIQGRVNQENPLRNITHIQRAGHIGTDSLTIGSEQDTSAVNSTNRCCSFALWKPQHRDLMSLLGEDNNRQQHTPERDKVNEVQEPPQLLSQGGNRNQNEKQGHHHPNRFR